MSAELVPTHVAIIMDGNGRWAQQRKLPRFAGHEQGVKATQEVVKACGEVRVKYLTLFAFSSENWQRPKSEVSALMGLFVRSLQSEVRNLAENGVRLKFLGQKEAFSKKLCQQIQQAEDLTVNNDQMFLNIAANYGGRWDILHAVRNITQEVQSGELETENINEAVLAGKLTTGNMPMPDLFIRTGGERRISNFLLWQLAYTELYFCDTLWPDFGEEELTKAFESYRTRQRRFGHTQEQVSSLSKC